MDAITLKESDNDQSDLLVEILNFKKQIKPKNKETKKQKEDVFNAFDIKIFPIKTEDTDFSDKVSDHSNLKLLTPNQIFQRSPIALA